MARLGIEQRGQAIGMLRACRSQTMSRLLRCARSTISRLWQKFQRFGTISLTYSFEVFEFEGITKGLNKCNLYLFRKHFPCFDVPGNVQDAPRASRSRVTTRLRKQLSMPYLIGRSWRFTTVHVVL